METEYEFRVLSRPAGSEGEWTPVYSRSAAGRPYRTLSAARAYVTRERGIDERRQWQTWLPKPLPRREFLIQRRPVTTDWEDVND